MTRQIKRYANRKLYDVQGSAYVSLQDVAAMIRRGDTVQIMDNASGDDITAQTLTQIVLEEGKRGTSMLPTDLLHEMLRRSGEVIDSRFEQIRHGVDELVQGSLGRLTRVLHGSRSDELQQLREQLSQLEQTLAGILRDRGNGAPGAEAGDGPEPIDPVR
jgi:polyhydroxyalkanoate synthesis repressor PhaR